MPRKKLIASAFSGKAGGYQKHADVQREMIGRLVKICFENNIHPWTIADLGCGTGFFSQQYKPVRGTCIIGVDLALNCLQSGRNRDGTIGVCADIDHLPLKPGTFDGVVLASVLQWLEKPEKALQTARALLIPGGVLLFACFTNETMQELAAIRKEHGLNGIGVNFGSIHATRTLIQRSGFEIIHEDDYLNRCFFKTGLAALKSVSTIGATAHGGIRLNREQLSGLCRDYEKRFKCDDGVPVSYRALIGVARKGKLAP